VEVQSHFTNLPPEPILCESCPSSDWVDWFNNRRLLEPIGNVPPTEFESMYYHQLEESAVAA
jgi:transposase InsO family protein